MTRAWVRPWPRPRGAGAPARRRAPADRSHARAPRTGAGAGRVHGPRVRAAVLHRLHGQCRRDPGAVWPRRRRGAGSTQPCVAARWRAAVGRAAAALRARRRGRRRRRCCSEAGERATLLATDGVFSMDGDIAPLAGTGAAGRAAQAWFLVDDAHGLGVIGARGRGALELAGLDAQQVPLLVGTLGKALGSFGAFVAGPADLIELVMQRARSYIFTTALPAPVAAATRAGAAHHRWRQRSARTRAGTDAALSRRCRATGSAAELHRPRPSSRWCWAIRGAALPRARH